MTMLAKFGSAVFDLLRSPLDGLGEILREPSKKWDHERMEDSKKSEASRKLDEINLAHEHEKKLRELDVDLSIKEQTGVSKALAEIEEIKKEKDFERMIRTTESIKKYLEELTVLKTDTIRSIGEMHLDLKSKAQDLVYNKTLQYQELQDKSFSKSMDELLIIEEKFSDNDAAKKILINAVDVKLSNIITTANNFLAELNRDIINLNNDISLLTKHGQNFIESHLSRISISSGFNENTLEAKQQVDINPILGGEKR